MNARSVRRIRDGIGLTQSQLGELLGVHPLTVSKWERGLLSPNKHQEQLLQSFRAAAHQDEGLGETIGQALVTVGVAAALFALLKAAFDE